MIPTQGIVEAALGIKDGKVAALLDPGVDLPAGKVIDAGGNHILPGVIEPHSHLALGNRVEDFATETKSAALGGVTTMFTYLRRQGLYDEMFPVMKEEAESRAYVDVAFHFGLMLSEQVDHLRRCFEDYGVSSFKFFMAYKGEEGRAMGIIGCDDGLMYRGFQQVAHMGQGVACVHAENVEIIDTLKPALRAAGRDDLAAWSEARPGFTEAESIQRAFFLGRETGCPVYIVHLSSAAGLEIVREWRQKEGVRYVETCTHYLTHTLRAKEGKLAKANPALRHEQDREALWQGLKDGSIHTVGTDHVPFTKTQKMVSIWDSPPGFPGSTTLLQVLLSEGYHKRGLSLEKIAEITSFNTARIFNLYPRKGTLQVGADADLVIVDLELERQVQAKNLLSYSDFSIYEGEILKGWPILTMVRGQVVMEKGEIVGPRGFGRYIYRNYTRG